MRHDRVFERFHVLRVDVGELPVGALFAIEKLQDHHAGNMFLQIRINACNRRANAAI